MIDPRNLFLFSGQNLTHKVGGKVGSQAAVQQLAVVADDERAAYAKLAELAPHFRPLGCASLAEYQSVVERLLRASRGEESDIRLLVGP